MKEQPQKIGLLDSGIGGTSVLKEIIKLLPNANYLYISDSKNNPYGDKSEEEIKQIVFKNIEFLIEDNCKIIVLACNTATAIAIDEARKKYKNVIIIGMEPAIKVEYDNQKSEKVLLLATKRTVESERFLKLKEKYPLKNLETVACPGLADLIENQNFIEIEKYIQNNLSKYSEVDSLILGCTHYPLIKDILKKYFLKAKIIDGSIGTANQVVRKSKEINLTTEKLILEFIDTKDTETKKEVFLKYLEI